MEIQTVLGNTQEICSNRGSILVMGSWVQRLSTLWLKRQRVRIMKEEREVQGRQ